jgi:predicted DNA binding protein
MLWQAKSMRKIILEAPKKEIDKIEKNNPLQNVEFSEVLHLLRFDRDEFAAILRVKFKDSSAKFEDLIAQGKFDKIVKVQLLERNKDGAFTYFITGKPPNTEGELLSFGSYPIPPFGVQNDKIKISFVGEATQLKNLLEHINRLGLNYKITSATEAKFSVTSPLNGLTEKQRTVIVSAFERGYYETPRRINSQKLADKLHIKTSTLVEHRRKAEQSLLSQIINEP